MNRMNTYSIDYAPSADIFDVDIVQDKLWAIIGYIDTLDSSMAQMFFDFTHAEGQYARRHNVTLNLTSQPGNTIHHDPVAFQTLIDYFNNTLIPYLESLNPNKILHKDGDGAKYNEAAESKFAEGKYWIRSLEDGDFDLYAGSIIYYATEFKQLYQHALNSGERITFGN